MTGPAPCDRIDIVGVYVTPDARGRGIVGLLFEALASWATDRGAEALTLDVHRDNARARQRQYPDQDFHVTHPTLMASSS